MKGVACNQKLQIVTPLSLDILFLYQLCDGKIMVSMATWPTGKWNEYG